MNRVVVDASALGAVAFQELGFEAVAGRLAGATVYAPSLLKFELANTALKKARRHPTDAARILTALAEVIGDRSKIVWQDINPADVALMAHATDLSAYDASYLWLAGSLGADLVTLDRLLAAAGSEAGEQT